MADLHEQVSTQRCWNVSFVNLYQPYRNSCRKHVGAYRKKNSEEVGNENLENLISVYFISIVGV